MYLETYIGIKQLKHTNRHTHVCVYFGLKMLHSFNVTISLLIRITYIFLKIYIMQETK